MITFYPRDIGLWRSEYNFKDRNKGYPSKQFETLDHLREYVFSNFTDLCEDVYPLKFIEENNVHFGTNLIVHKWTVLGWAKEEN